MFRNGWKNHLYTRERERREKREERREKREERREKREERREKREERREKREERREKREERREKREERREREKREREREKETVLDTSTVQKYRMIPNIPVKREFFRNAGLYFRIISQTENSDDLPTCDVLSERQATRDSPPSVSPEIWPRSNASGRRNHGTCCSEDNPASRCDPTRHVGHVPSKEKKPPP